MGSKKAKKDSKAKAAVRTSPRKQKASRDADPDEDSQEQSQEPSDEPERREALLEGDEAKGPEGDGEKPDKIGTVWTPEQDEQNNRGVLYHYVKMKTSFNCTHPSNSEIWPATKGYTKSTISTKVIFSKIKNPGNLAVDKFNIACTWWMHAFL